MVEAINTDEVLNQRNRFPIKGVLDYLKLFGLVLLLFQLLKNLAQMEGVKRIKCEF